MTKGRAKTADNAGFGTADDDDDFTPSPRDPLHAHPDLCKANLERLVTDIPLEIRASNISSGSGLFPGADIEAGREIYNVYPAMKVLEANNDSFCHYCFEDSQPVLGGASKPKQPTKACTGCNVARFCHKVDNCAVETVKSHTRADDVLLPGMPEICLDPAAQR